MPCRILIVDNSAKDRAVLRALLEGAFYVISEASDAREAQKYAIEEEPDVIISEVHLSDGSGVELCRALKRDTRTAHIPLILATHELDETIATEGLQAGAEDVLPKPVTIAFLFARLRALQKATTVVDELRLRSVDLPDRRMAVAAEEESNSIEPRRAVLLPSSAAEADMWAKAIQKLPAMMPIVISPGTAYTASSDMPRAPELFVVSHLGGEGGNGLKQVAALRADIATRTSVVIAVAPPGNGVFSPRAFDLGANDVVEEPYVASELPWRLRAQLRRKGYLDRLRGHLRDGVTLSMIDALTGLHNRRFLYENLAPLLERSRMSASTFAILIFDIDRFKSVNDNFGHPSGDAVLVEIAQRLKENVRAADLLSRLGGEEFCLAMPDTDLDMALQTAERVRHAVASEDFILPTGDELRITTSVGVAVAPTGVADPSGLLAAADRALYASKNAGRNKVTLAEAS